MYDKHSNKKILYQAIVDNCLSVEFNTQKKRDNFVKVIGRCNNHKITCTSNVGYPWNYEDGIHNLKSPEEFAKIIKSSTDKIVRAIRNKHLQTETVGHQQYIVEKNQTYNIKGHHYII